MATATREAPSVIKPWALKEDILRRIVGLEMETIFLRPHLNKGQIWATNIGFIGDRGGGKSTSCGAVGMIDFGFSGMPIYSNIDIACDIVINDETARKYGLKTGGTVHFQSMPLEKDALLRIDERFRRCCIIIEEINVQYSNVRRFMSNTNVDFNQVCQQLRHIECPLVYNVIDEMFIDPQLRTLTDIFIRTNDTAFEIDNLASEKPRGLDFRWKIYPMTGYLMGEENRYAVTKKTKTAFFHYEIFHGLLNSMKNQEQGVYTMSTKDKNKMMMQMTTESSEEMSLVMNEYQWLWDKIIAWKRHGKTFMQPFELRQAVGQPITEGVKDVLRAGGVHWDSPAQGYIIENYDLESHPLLVGANI